MSLAVLLMQLATVHLAWSTNGGEEYPFGNVSGVVAMEDGTMWVTDKLSSYRLHRLDADGNVIDRKGREGEGPGELKCANALAATPEGGFAVLCSNVLHEFTGEGEFVGRLHLAQLVWNPKDMLITEDRVIISGALSGAKPNTAAPKSTAIFDRRHGLLIDSIHPIVPSEVARNSLYVSGGALAEVGDDAILVANGAPFRLVRYGGGAGELVSDPELVPDVADEFTYEDGRYMGQPIYSHRWNHARVTYLGVEPDGRLLAVARWRRDEGGVERSVWTWYDRSGRQLERIDAPVGYEVHASTLDGAYLGVWYDTMDQAHVARLEIR